MYKVQRRATPGKQKATSAKEKDSRLVEEKGLEVHHHLQDMVQQLFGPINSLPKKLSIWYLEPWPDIHRFEAWKSHFYREVAAKSGRPHEAMAWLQEIENTTDCSTLFSPTSKDGQDFSSLDFKIASGLWKILKGDMERQLINEDKKQRQNNLLRILSGRQIAFIIFGHFTLPHAERGLMDVTHLANLEVKNDNLKQFDYKWDAILLKIQPEPPDIIL